MNLRYSSNNSPFCTKENPELGFRRSDIVLTHKPESKVKMEKMQDYEEPDEPTRVRAKQTISSDCDRVKRNRKL